MTLCLDIHTHHPAPQPQAVVSVGIEDFNPIEGQYYSVGIHPWQTTRNITVEEWAQLDRIAALPCVVAIGECGIDKLKGGPMFRQLLVWKHQIELSEKLGKPLIVHDVKAHDIIVGIKKDMLPTQPWVVHGLRAKPTVAKMLTDEGMFISFGEKFNPDTPAAVPQNLLLAETDESQLTIEEIIANLSTNLSMDMLPLIAANTQRFLFGNTTIEIVEDEIFL